jgi:hypothetical protein
MPPGGIAGIGLSFLGFLGGHRLGGDQNARDRCPVLQRDANQ